MNFYFTYIVTTSLLILLSVWLTIHYNKKKKILQTELELQKNNYKKIKEKQLSESKELDIYKEELKAQTEHLLELNVELERLSLVASHTDNGVLIADKTGEMLWINKGFTKLTGFTLDDFNSLSRTNIFETSYKKDLKLFVEKCIKTKSPINYISEFKTKSEQTIWLNTLINPIINEDKEIKQFILIDTDVSNLKKMNDELKQLSVVAKKNSNSTLIYDADEKLTFTNEGFQNLYGKTQNEFENMYGNSFDDFCTLNNKPNLKQDLLEKKEAVTFIRKFKSKDEEVKWKQTNITPVFNNSSTLKNFIVIESDITKIKIAEKKIQEEKNKTDKLLLNILPEETAEELKTNGEAKPRFYRNASILFADFESFTKKVENLTPNELVAVLQNYFSRFDDAATKFLVEKIKIIGDAFLCVGGIPMKNNSHPFDTILVGLELQKIMKDLSKHEIIVEGTKIALDEWKLRVGIHSGPLVAGIVGKTKISYDIWGDSVNVAKRLESACVPGMVNISESTYRLVKDYFICENRGKVLAKNKGHIKMFFVHRLKEEFSEDEKGLIPNQKFNNMLSKL